MQATTTTAMMTNYNDNSYYDNGYNYDGYDNDGYNDKSYDDTGYDNDTVEDFQTELGLFWDTFLTYILALTSQINSLSTKLTFNGHRLDQLFDSLSTKLTFDGSNPIA